MQWIPFAMVRITVVFTAGVLLNIYDPEILTKDQSMVLFLGFVVLYFPAHSFFKNTSYVKTVSGFIGLVTIFVAGYLNVLTHNESRLPDHLIQNSDQVLISRVKVLGYTEHKKNSFRRLVSVESIATSKGWKMAVGNVYLYWPLSENISDLDYGDQLLIHGTPLEVEGPLNPDEFDYKKFLGYRNIYHQQFVMAGGWKLIRRSDERGFWFYALRARAWSVHAIEQYVHEPRQQAIAIALVLGVTDGIDDELLGAYAASGAMHVLAVSGMHVSIIYAVLLFMMNPLRRIPGGEWLIAIVSLILLWGYGFVTGLSPSVLRAVAMFSFVALAGPFARRTNIYNTLAASAFCLLVYDPFLIMSVGFQLSYLAVWGIVYIYRPIYNLWEAKSWLMNWIWQITCVSIAAQIATLPIVLLYFHQFPVYSLLANLFVIPGSSVILLGGVLLLMVSPISFMAIWAGIGLEWCVKFFNAGIFLVEDLPASLIGDIYISPIQAIFISMAMISVMLLLQYRKFKFVMLFAGACVLFSLSSWIHLEEEVQPAAMIIYAVKGHRLIDWRAYGQSLFLTDSAILNDVRKIKFHISPSRLRSGVIREEVDLLKLDLSIQHVKFYRWRRKTFLFIDGRTYHLPEKLSVDYLIVSNNSVISLKEILKHAAFKSIILDGTNAMPYSDRLRKEAQNLDIDYHFVLKDGSYTLNL